MEALPIFCNHRLTCLTTQPRVSAQEANFEGDLQGDHQLSSMTHHYHCKYKPTCVADQPRASAQAATSSGTPLWIMLAQSSTGAPGAAPPLVAAPVSGPELAAGLGSGATRVFVVSLATAALLRKLASRRARPGVAAARLCVQKRAGALDDKHIMEA